MIQLTGFENARVMTGESNRLPKGGYIVKIMDCHEVTGVSKKNGNRYVALDFSFDICEGEYKNHFSNMYTVNTDENKKWKGICRVYIPQEGELRYEDNLSRFKTMIANFEESNPGYKWEWDEKTLKNKIIGVVFAEEEFQRKGDGRIAVACKVRYFTSVERIRNGKYKIPEVKRLPNSVLTSSVFDEFTPDTNEKLPWE